MKVLIKIVVLSKITEFIIKSNLLLRVFLV